MGEPVHGYFLYVNQQRVPKVFIEQEEAEEDAKPHITESRSASDQVNLGVGSHLEL